MDDIYRQQILIDEAYDNNMLEVFPYRHRNLFRLSFGDRTGKVYEPEIPLHRADGEDNTIARVCFADTIEGCFRAMPECGAFINGMMCRRSVDSHILLYVHIPIFDEDFVHAAETGLVAYPNGRLVPDSHITQEVWVMDNVRVECVAKIRAWYDIAGWPDFGSVEDLPVGLELVECNPNDREWILDALQEHPAYVEDNILSYINKQTHTDCRW